MVKKTKAIENVVELKAKYSAWIGFVKSAKNTAIVFIPAVLAFLANVPPEYAWIAGLLTYMLKNYAEIAQDIKL